MSLLPKDDYYEPWHLASIKEAEENLVNLTRLLAEFDSGRHDNSRLPSRELIVHAIQSTEAFLQTLQGSNARANS
jgi:hypothetical protein